MIRKSLTAKIIVVFSLILVAVVALNIIINGLLLQKVYSAKKFDAMEDLYLQLNESYANGFNSEMVVDIVKNTLSKENLRVFIFDKNNRLIIDSLPLSHAEEYSFNENEPKSKSSKFDDNRNKFFRFKQHELFMFDINIKEEHIINAGNNFLLFFFESFDNLEEKNIYLRGYLPGEYKVLIQMPFASISEAVYISNILLLIVGIAMLLIGVLVVSITARGIAKPVKELSSIAKSMQELNFSSKYISNRKDEIGSLGESINSLSEKLENTINELFEKNAKLQEDIELKSKIDKMRKDFIANASHELKTPVALIQGYAEGLRDNVVIDEENKKLYTNVIIEETERMNHIIHQMLDLMEIDGKEEILNGHKFSLSDVVEDAINSFDVVLKNRNINLIYEHDGNIDVFGDYLKIHQAITNYISNAINHVDDEKIIKVKVKNLGDKAEVSVYNKGVCIPCEDLDNIWEKFYKVDKAHTREYGGSGIGLSIVKSVIELHNGEYGVRNHSDGVEFYFIIKKGENHEN